MQTCITYKHAPNLWKGPVPKYDDKALPRSIHHLVNKTPLSIVLVGDSISAGCNASGWADGAPYQPPYPELLRQYPGESISWNCHADESFCERNRQQMGPGTDG